MGLSQVSMGARQGGTRMITKSVVPLLEEVEEGLAHLLCRPLVCHCGCVAASGQAVLEREQRIAAPDAMEAGEEAVCFGPVERVEGDSGVVMAG
jgi:hypothetical protein